MNIYNERWTREKFLEYRKLKRIGYSDNMLIEHFGEDIYHSGLYNKFGRSLPNILKFGNYINEIGINPEVVDYSFIKQPSKYISGKSDYIISFFSNNIPYILALVYFPIGEIETLNIVFTTRDGWNDYEYNLINFLKKGYLNEDEFLELDDIISRKTGYNDIIPIFKKVCWILPDFYKKNIKGKILSIGDTVDKKKINFYRNIIKDSFNDVIESEHHLGDNKYFIYSIIDSNK
jgi:hypothetical protein